MVFCLVIKQIPAWSTSQAQRAVGTPKLAFVDTGIAAHLIGQDTARLGRVTGSGRR
jgi:predicted AAA+ superfamily ATPase